MSTQINSINGTSAASSTTSTSSSSSAQPLTEATKQQLQALGVDTSNITSEMQGQIALLQAQQQQQTQQASGSEHHHSGSGKAEMEAMKSQATELAGKLGITVSSNEKLDDIMAAIGPALQSKVSAAGNDQTKLAEVQVLQSEYDSISSSLSSMQAQHTQSAQSSQGAQAIGASLSNMASQNKFYHQM